MMKRYLVLIVTVFVLSAALIAPVAAQEASPTESQPVAGAVESTPDTETASGAGTFMLLIGVGAVVTVGGLSILRQNFRSQHPQ